MELLDKKILYVSKCLLHGKNICQLWKMYKYSDKCILNVIIIFKHNFLILFTKYLNIFIATCIIYITVPVCLKRYISSPP